MAQVPLKLPQLLIVCAAVAQTCLHFSLMQMLHLLTESFGAVARSSGLVRADLESNHLVTKRCPLLPWISGVAAGVLVGPD